jgi:hypothetical protein
LSVDDAVRVTVEETIAFWAGAIHATDGGVVSAPASVVPLAMLDEALTFPTLSRAVT